MTKTFKFLFSIWMFFACTMQSIPAQTASSSHIITTIVPEVAQLAIIEINDDFDTPNKKTSTYLNYTSTVENGKSRSIRVRVNENIPKDMELIIQPAEAIPAKDGTYGNRGTKAIAIFDSSNESTPQNLVTDIRNCHTGIGNEGIRLEITFHDKKGDCKKSNMNTPTVGLIYTISEDV